MADFRGDLKRFAQKTDLRVQGTFVRAAQAVHQSIQEGSAVTGSPGQPVDTGALRASWILRYESPTSAMISTNLDYAPIIEDNIRGARLKSAVGGFHSVKMTIAGWPRLLASVAREVIS